jgi:hypothetical protein
MTTAMFPVILCKADVMLQLHFRFTLFDLLKSLYSDTKILSKYIPSLQKRL